MTCKIWPPRSIRADVRVHTETPPNEIDYGAAEKSNLISKISKFLSSCRSFQAWVFIYFRSLISAAFRYVFFHFDRINVLYLYLIHVKLLNSIEEWFVWNWLCNFQREMFNNGITELGKGSSERERYTLESNKFRTSERFRIRKY